MTRPVRLTPSLRKKDWGRTGLGPWFPDSPEPIGEAWYLAEHSLPLLVKLIFTDDKLSLQLHPDDDDDAPSGKSEMWHILEAEPGASLALGFKEPISRERLREATLSGEIADLVNWMEVHPGDTFYTPAHTVHAIGAGIVLCEIQQNADITYRLWDYGRRRELHIEKALPIADLGVHPGKVRPVPLAEGYEELVRAKHFITHRRCLKAGQEHRPEAKTCQLWIVLEGQGAIGGEPYQRGEVWMLPDSGEQPMIRAAKTSQFLRTWAP
jgi:mannose-6-phosphate isomerase